MSNEIFQKFENHLAKCPYTYSAEVKMRITKPGIKTIDTLFTTISGSKIGNQDIFSAVVDTAFDYYGDNILRKQGDDDYTNYVQSDFSFIIGGNWFHKYGGTIMMQEHGSDELLFIHIKVSKTKTKNGIIM